MQKEKMTKGSDNITKKVFSSPMLLILAFQIALFPVAAYKSAGDYYLEVLFVVVMINIILFILTIYFDNSFLIYMALVTILTIGAFLQSVLATYSDAPLEMIEKYRTNLIVSFVVAAIFYVVCIRGGKGDFSFLKKKSIVWILCGVSIFLYLIALMAAPRLGGVANWISIFGMSLQITEITKAIYMCTVVILLCLSSWSTKTKIMIIAIFTVINMLFLVMIGELGILLLLILWLVFLIFMQAKNIKQYLKGILIAIGVVFASVIGGKGILVLSSFEKFQNSLLIEKTAHALVKVNERVSLYIDPYGADPYGAGYQFRMARQALYNGGWFGTELPDTAVPIKSSDFAFIALVEATGCIFAIVLVVMFFVFLIGGLKIFTDKEVAYPLKSIIALSIVFAIIIQAVYNMAASLGLMPLSGVTLPFVSAGGTSITINMIMVFVLMAISIPQGGNPLGMKQNG